MELLDLWHRLSKAEYFQRHPVGPLQHIQSLEPMMPIYVPAAAERFSKRSVVPMSAQGRIQPAMRVLDVSATSSV